MRAALIPCLVALLAAPVAAEPFDPHAVARTLRAADDKASSPEGQTLREDALKRLRAQVVLTLGDVRHQATSIYVCRGLHADGDEPARRCHGWVADDTIHTTEYPPFEIVKPGARPLHIVGLAGIQLIALDHGQPGPMHGTGYRDVVPLKIAPDGRLTLPPVDARGTRPGLLMAYGRLPAIDDKPGRVAKWVWVVDLTTEKPGARGQGAGKPAGERLNAR